MGWFLAVALMGATIVGCDGEDGATLLLDVVTDYVPGEEFTAVRATVRRAGDPAAEALARRESVHAGGDFVRGVRVAEIGGLEAEDYAVHVELLGPRLRVLDTRDLLVRVAGNTVQPVVITRNCRGVSCDSGAACIDAQCVTMDCAQSPEGCPETFGCQTNDDCLETVDCTQGVCDRTSGACLQALREGACADNQWCHPERGCERSSLPMDGRDAEPADASVPDAATDAQVPSCTMRGPPGRFAPEPELLPLRIVGSDLTPGDGVDLVVVMTTDGDQLVRAWDRIPVEGGAVDRTYRALEPSVDYAIHAYVDADDDGRCEIGEHSEIANGVAPAAGAVTHTLAQPEVPKLCAVGGFAFPHDGDGNFSGCTDEVDLQTVDALWGQTGDQLEADLNRDGTVDGLDLSQAIGTTWCTCSLNYPWAQLP